jgi:hypothetical protein
MQKVVGSNSFSRLRTGSCSTAEFRRSPVADVDITPTAADVTAVSAAECGLTKTLPIERDWLGLRVCPGPSDPRLRFRP